MSSVTKIEDLISLAIFGVSLSLTIISIIRMFTRYWLIENKRQFALFILLSLSTSLWALATNLTRKGTMNNNLEWLSLFFMGWSFSVYFLSLRKRIEPSYSLYPNLMVILTTLGLAFIGIKLAGYHNHNWIIVSSVCIFLVLSYNAVVAYQISRLEMNTFYKFLSILMAGFTLLNGLDNLSGLLWQINTHLIFLGGGLFFIMSLGVYVMDQAYHNATSDLTRRIAAVEEEYAAAVENTENVVISLARTLEAKDRYTEGHSERVSQYAVMLGKKLGLANDLLEELRIGGLVHDIGKIGIDQQILNKPGRLDDEERKIIESHPVTGENICSPLKSFASVMPLIRNHHEKIDGSGYPDGLVENDLSLQIKIITVADIYDALTTDRPYRPAMNQEHAFNILKQEARDGKLDAKIVDALIEAILNDLSSQGSYNPQRV